MNSRSLWTIGNWKQNPATIAQATQLASDLVTHEQLTNSSNVNIAVAPTSIHASSVSELLNEHISLASQDVSKQDVATGAFTGDVSAAQLQDLGVSMVLVGHSERREYHNECSDTLVQKIQASLAQGLRVVYCIGESLQQRENNEHFAHITNQVTEVVSKVTSLINPNNFIVAYEPIWAIGTGLTASVDEINEMHKHVRDTLAAVNSEFVQISVLYGGSVKPTNVQEIAACIDVDGALVGGASLNADDFLVISKAFHEK